jgi:RNA polymerase sigma-70 factor (ECF subfamily)
MEYSSATANELTALCADAGNEAAWREFVGRFQRSIALTVLRTARGWGEPTTLLVDDLVQETFLRLCVDNCRLLHGFVERHENSMLGYLKAIAANVTHDHFRSEAAQKRGAGLREPLGQDLRQAEADLSLREASVHAARRAKQFEIEIQIGEVDRLLRSFPADVLPERDRLIFWLYYREGYTAREIGVIPAFGLSVKGVESAIFRTTNLLRQAMKPSSTISSKGNCRRSTISK